MYKILIRIYFRKPLLHLVTHGWSHMQELRVFKCQTVVLSLTCGRCVPNKPAGISAIGRLTACDWISSWDFTLENDLIIQLQLVISLPVCYSLSWGYPTDRSFAFSWSDPFLTFTHSCFVIGPLLQCRSVNRCYKSSPDLNRARWICLPVFF